MKFNIFLDMTKCKAENCLKNGVFGYVGSKENFCKIHKQSNMIDIINKKCEFENCNYQPTYDMKGGKGKYCKYGKREPKS